MPTKGKQKGEIEQVKTPVERRQRKKNCEGPQTTTKF